MAKVKRISSLKEYLFQRGLNAVDVAAMARGRLSKSTVYNIINGVTTPTTTTFHKLAEALKMPVDDLARLVSGRQMKVPAGAKKPRGRGRPIGSMKV